MRNFDRSVIVSVLCLAGLAIAPVVACSSTPTDAAAGAGNEEGGTSGALPDGALPDGQVEPPKTCATGADCSSNVCGPDKLCRPASGSDGVKNGDETDSDCGGSVSKPCEDGKTCKAAKDCNSGVCTGGICQAPSPTDGAKNADETDIDCGGSKAAACGIGKGCKKSADCVDRICTSGKCIMRAPADGVKNGDETDIDCGGTLSPPCASGQACLALTDCDNVLCTGNVCQPPSTTDGLKNGTESDIDCGGASGTLCVTGKICTLHGDCASDGCAYDGKCALGRSCTLNHGGATCGKGEFNAGDAAHESCCTEIAVARPAGAFVMDKYLVTAGRMRAFFERVNGDVKGFVEGNPKWVPSWSVNMPTNMTEALANVGPVPLEWDWSDGTNQARGCQIAGGGARTYWQPDVTPAEKNYYSKDVLDEKPINCLNLPLLLAFCIWDGKDLPTVAELQYAWNKGEPANYRFPWGNAPGLPTTDFDASNQYLVHKRGYMYPGYANPDASYNIGAPGRRFLGAGPFGHLDLAGDVFEYARSTAVAPLPQARINSGSWENHVPTGSGGAISAAETWRRYYAFGGRCGSR